MIRNVTIKDADAIINLLAQLGYAETENFLLQKLEKMLRHPDERMLVFVNEEDVVLGFLSLHFIPQIALLGDFARISYFVVNGNERGKNIGKELEEAATKLARENGCNRMEVHCHERRKEAHRFYLRQGYEESPKYFIKKL